MNRLQNYIQLLNQNGGSTSPEEEERLKYILEMLAVGDKETEIPKIVTEIGKIALKPMTDDNGKFFDDLGIDWVTQMKPKLETERDRLLAKIGKTPAASPKPAAAASPAAAAAAAAAAAPAASAAAAAGEGAAAAAAAAGAAAAAAAAEAATASSQAQPSASAASAAAAEAA